MWASPADEGKPGRAVGEHAPRDQAAWFDDFSTVIPAVWDEKR